MKESTLKLVSLEKNGIVSMDRHENVIGITASAFDLFHTGHVLMLEEAAGKCDWLICALHVNPSMENFTKSEPVQTVYERKIQLEACLHVDEIIIYETERDLKHILTDPRNAIDIRIIGEEYFDRDYTGKDLCISGDMEVHFNQRKHYYSSTELRNRVEARNTIDDL